MKRKVIAVPAEVEGHIKNVLESNNAEIIGIVPEYFEESKYHSNGNYNEVAFIGEFQVEYGENPISERIIVDQIPYGKNVYNYQIHMYSNEGPVPHFHIKGNGKDVCICIYEPRYFDHGTHTGTLDKKELKALNEFLKSDYDPHNTYWNHISNEWYALNKDYYRKYPNYPITDTQPDYTHIQGYKSGKMY